MKALNLYAGIGGNRKLWKNVDVTAVEIDIKIAKLYGELYPEDKVVIGDAHDYLLNNYNDYDFIWSSPPCQSHSRMIISGRNRKPRYPDLKLYEEILFLSSNFPGKWVVENVKPYYDPLIQPSNQVGRHLFWSNFEFTCNDIPSPVNFINRATKNGAEELKVWLGIEYEGSLYYDGNHCPAQVLRNCVHPVIGKQIMDSLNGDVNNNYDVEFYQMGLL